MLIIDDDDGEEIDTDQHIYMELQSTVSFKEIDIDKMLEHTTLDDFLRGLYINSVTSGGATQKGTQSEHDRLMGMLTGTKASEETRRGPELVFEERKTDEAIEMLRGDNLRKLAL